MFFPGKVENWVVILDLNEMGLLDIPKAFGE